ncbi:MAG: c-type cytochrome [Leptospiraceae bacterium]|nr:c-type cytochrome [Leptospiraceae bacterium]
MSKALKGIGILAGLLLVGIVALLSYLYLALPYDDYPAFESDNSAESVERGRYLANHVAVCVDCHSVRDWSHYSGPIVPGTEGRGGEVFDQKLGFPGRFIAKNITSAALKEWNDAELARAITSGVSRNGDPFFPVMPYPSYSRMTARDLSAIVAYLRTLAPVDHPVEASRPDFPMNLILRTIPSAHEPMQYDASDPVQYGKYLVTIGGCADCHTPQEKGSRIEGMYLAGGFDFPLPDGSVVSSANITPDPETGIGNWDERTFVERFKSYSGPVPEVATGEKNTYMPWTMYAGMEEDDLRAIYAYLKTVKPVSNSVNVFSPADQSIP